MKIVLNLGVIQVLARVSPWCIGFVYKGPWCLGFESRWEPGFLETLSPKQSLYIEVLDLIIRLQVQLVKIEQRLLGSCVFLTPYSRLALHNLIN